MAESGPLESKPDSGNQVYCQVKPWQAHPCQGIQIMDRPELGAAAELQGVPSWYQCRWDAQEPVKERPRLGGCDVRDENSNSFGSA